jgi:hypothetical protein
MYETIESLYYGNRNLSEWDKFIGDYTKSQSDKFYNILDQLELEKRAYFDLESSVTDCMVASERAGFVLGFKQATALWRECL